MQFKSEDVAIVTRFPHLNGRRIIYQRACNVFNQSTHLFYPDQCYLMGAFSRIPARCSNEATESVGNAPFLIQPRAFSLSMLMEEGLVSGLYQPMFSIMRPSRGERASATTTR